MSPRVVAGIFARGGSKGIPRKNLQVVAGCSLVCRAVRVAAACSRVERVFISTDDSEIAEEGRRCGAEVPFLRPAELAHDETPEWLAWQHAIDSLRSDPGGGPDIMVVLPPTAPLRTVADVDACLDTLIASDADAVVTVASAAKNPFFNMVTLDSSGAVHLAIPQAGRLTRRQDAPTVWDLTTVAYAVRAEFVMRAEGLFAGRLRAVVVPRERALDIDTAFDLSVARLLMSRAEDSVELD